MSAMDVVMGTVDLPEEMIDKLTANSAYGARVLENVRTAVVERFGGMSRVKLEDVLAVLDQHLDSYREGATREAWLKPRDEPVRPPAKTRPVKDAPQA